MILFITGWIVGWVALAVVIFLGVNHSINESERTKNIVTESDLYNYYKGE